MDGEEDCDLRPDHHFRGLETESTGGGTSIHITALDGIVNVNSLFTLAVFIGLAWNPSRYPDGGLPDSDCAASNRVAEDLVSFHVFSFSAFLFSSLVALCLKQAIRIVRPHGRTARVNKALLRGGILSSAVGSVLGCGFLTLALVNVVQIKLGRLDCSGAAVGAIVPIVTLIPIAMLIYSGIVFYAFTRRSHHGRR
ncbi:uncharacterized protein LOC122008361 [Zingiber officinale]|uniref:Maternal effect embryo arrest 60 n=1 Tax=Zingiber officinale TaxID=94328 RepID=A0A8J5KMJ2_ZINOF|nr:uncharacterized protein LOC122008361 [Zingiber officinale]KAG6485916.1 hypothetical protein ZIOFF_054483 [Zingiber officinale]